MARSPPHGADSATRASAGCAGPWAAWRAPSKHGHGVTLCLVLGPTLFFVLCVRPAPGGPAHICWSEVSSAPGGVSLKEPRAGGCPGVPGSPRAPQCGRPGKQSSKGPGHSCPCLWVIEGARSENPVSGSSAGSL